MIRSRRIHISALFWVMSMARDNDYGKLARSAISEGRLRMSHRLFASTAAALTALVMLCAQTPASGQTAPAATKAVKTTAGTNKAWTPPRTPDGHPDLQGDLDQQHRNTPRTAQRTGCERILYRRGTGGPDEKRPGPRGAQQRGGSPDRAGNQRGCALRLHPIRVGPRPSQALLEPADLTDRGGAGNLASDAA